MKAQRKSASRFGGAFWCSLPVFAWLLWFLLAPLAIVLAYSLFTRGPYGNVVYDVTPANYVRLADELYLSIWASSFKLAGSVTLICLLLGYPMALAMARASATWRSLLFYALMVPFLSNFVVRAYAIKVLLSKDGPLSALAVALGFYTTAPSFTDSAFAVALGMITNYLPFMVLPIYVALGRCDFTLIEAARDLGAGDFAAFRRVLWPLTRAGVFAGCLLVFVPTLGEFTIPDLLGGARTMLLGNLVTEQFLKARDWPFGAALVASLVAVMLIGHAVEVRLKKLSAERRSSATIPKEAV